LDRGRRRLEAGHMDRGEEFAYKLGGAVAGLGKVLEGVVFGRK
jgi:hypothetical protein